MLRNETEDLDITKPNLKKNHLHTAKVMIMGSSMKYGVIVDDNIVSISEDG